MASILSVSYTHLDVYKRQALFHSWLQVEGNVSDNNEIDAWIAELNNNTKVDIHKIALKQSDFWFYDEDADVYKRQA